MLVDLFSSRYFIHFLIVSSMFYISIRKSLELQGIFFTFKPLPCIQKGKSCSKKTSEKSIHVQYKIGKSIVSFDTGR